MAGALAAVKLHVPVVHIEAGLRSFNKRMPEEVNRIVCDHSSTLLFSPTDTGIANLEKEGFNLTIPQNPDADNPAVYHSGDVMMDNSLFFSEVADSKDFLSELSGEDFILCTIHRPYNTDKPERLKQVMESLIQLVESFSIKLVFPIHPRTKSLLEANLPEVLASLENHQGIHIIDPVGFLEMTYLEKYCKLVITDSGGVQKESYFHQKPCIIIRSETEWVELVEMGWAELCFDLGEKLHHSVHRFLNQPLPEFQEVYGDGKAAEFIANKIVDLIGA